MPDRDRYAPTSYQWLLANIDTLTAQEYVAAALALDAERRMASQRRTPRRELAVGT